MKPDINTVFPQYDGNKKIEIEKIKISRNHRRIELLLSDTIEDNILDDFEDKVIKEYHLTGMNIKYPNEEKEEERDTFYITPPENQTGGDTPQKPVTLGKAHPEEMLLGRTIHDELIPISAINDSSTWVCFRGEIFNVEYKEITSKKTQTQFSLFMFDLTDYNDSISAQVFIKKDGKHDAACALLKDRLKKGLWVVVKGKAQYNDYAKEVIVSANSIGTTKGPKKRMDNAPKKRVELHLHTQMSAMDGVSSAKDLINRAISWGHTAIALTDHGVVQSYPDAMKASNNNEKIKVLYGVEGYLINDDAKIVYDPNGQKISDSFVVFDIETTGLSSEKNNITEIGAVKVSDGKIVDTWSTFVNPGEKIPPEITDLTGITDSMVADAPKIGEILGDFLQFCEGSVLVAHNAKFDVGFIKTACKRNNIEFNLTWLDTLLLARCLYPDLPKHTLDFLSKHLNVLLENHHRAVDDAKATADIFVKMLNELEEKGISELDGLNEHFDLAQASKKNPRYHIILLAKNEIGIRHIYEMVTDSHLKYYFRRPQIPKSLLIKKREGLLIGSACEAGELIRAMVAGESEEKIEEIASFYDYLEIQPIGNQRKAPRYQYRRGSQGS